MIISNAGLLGNNIYNTVGRRSPDEILTSSEIEMAQKDRCKRLPDEPNPLGISRDRTGRSTHFAELFFLPPREPETEKVAKKEVINIIMDYGCSRADKIGQCEIFGEARFHLTLNIRKHVGKAEEMVLLDLLHLKGLIISVFSQEPPLTVFER